jgi:hypothetical protein
MAAFALMALVGWYVYAYLTHETISIDLFGVPMPSTSIALLVLAPVFILYVGSVLHMAFYSMLANLKIRKTEKDYEKLFDSIIDAYLGKADRKHNFKTPTFELFGNLLDNSVVFPSKKIVLSADDDKSKKVNAALTTIEDIKNGEIVDLKAYSLSMDNELVVQNNRNMYKKGNITSEDILSRSNKYAESLCKEVYVDYVKNASVGAIDKYKKYLTKNALYVILSRVNANENTLEISNEAILTLLSALEFDMKDYLHIAYITSSGMIPEQRIKLFETLSNQNDEATDAYLFTLFDLEMLSPAYALLDISQPDEYLNFKAYRALKECNQQFSIELFI